MNKIKSIICVFVLTMLVFNSCDDTNGNAYEQKRRAIQKCIDKSDFKGAHEVLASITPVYRAHENKEIEYSQFDELQMIVYRAEIRYLVDQNDDASWKRAFFLIQEYKRANDYPPSEYEDKLELSGSLMEYALIFKHEETASSIRDYTKRLSREIGSRMGELQGIRDDKYKVLKKQAGEIASKYSLVDGYNPTNEQIKDVNIGHRPTIGDRSKDDLDDGIINMDSLYNRVYHEINMDSLYNRVYHEIKKQGITNN